MRIGDHKNVAVGEKYMKTIIVWLSAHPIVAWLITGFDVLAGLIIVVWLTIWVLAHLFALIHFRRRKDRSGADLSNAVFAIKHDDALDEIVFSWTLTNRGNFGARQLRMGANFRANQKDGQIASLRLTKEMAVLAPGDCVEVAIRIARSELGRQARDFDEGSVGFWCNYSLASPKKPAGGFVAFGPKQRFKLAVGQIGGQNCITVTDLMPIDYFQHHIVPI